MAGLKPATKQRVNQEKGDNRPLPEVDRSDPQRGRGGQWAPDTEHAGVVEGVVERVEVPDQVAVLQAPHSGHRAARVGGSGGGGGGRLRRVLK